ncbi:MAG: DUF2169 domain-containing protein [Burkholderiales bacterium]|nr:DUF2169 domain-containing protein [Burkholderiales bacterium]
MADTTVAVDKTGQEHLLIIVKGSWQFSNGVVRPMAAMPVQYSDICTANSIPLYESDFAPTKPRCDVLFSARAYAPDGKPVRELLAGYQIGAHQKILRVHGPRTWQGENAAAGNAEEFLTMPLHYGFAFGGTRPLPQAGQSESYAANPLGCGYSTDPAAVAGLVMPSLEAHNQAILRPDEQYPPAALSVLARNWLPRRPLSGTYDAAWKRDVFPFLPEDFDTRFYQAAPEDQQIDYPQGGEEVVLWNLMPKQAEMRFKLPRLDKVPVRILMRDFTIEQPKVVVDTLFFEPDQARFTAVWRTSIPIKRRIQDVKTIAIAGICKNWWEAKIVGMDACTNCAKQRSTQEAAPNEEECHEGQA